MPSALPSTPDLLKSQQDSEICITVHVRHVERNLQKLM